MDFPPDLAPFLARWAEENRKARIREWADRGSKPPEPQPPAANPPEGTGYWWFGTKKSGAPLMGWAKAGAMRPDGAGWWCHENAKQWTRFVEGKT